MNKKLTTKTISYVASFLLATSSNLYSQDLSEITVTSATKSEQSIKDVTSNIEVITKEEIAERHFTTVNEAINTLAGINIVSNGGMGKSSSVYMRGFDTERILVLIDGIRYNDFTGISGARFEHLMINEIEQIEVIKGAQSGIWGADATAGVINIITKSAKIGFSANTNVEYGSFNSKKVQASVSNKTDKYDLKLSLTRVLSDGITSRAQKGVNIDNYEADSYENTTINLKTGFNIDDNNRIEFKHNIIKTKSEYDSSLSLQDGYKLYSNNNFSSLNYSNINKYFSTKIYGNYTKINRDDPAGWTKTFDGSRNEFGTNFKIPYSKESFILTGFDYSSSNHKNESSEKIKNKGLFFTNSSKIGNTIFTQSLRYDDFNKFNNKTTGKIGLKYNISDDLYLSSNYGISYNTPTIYKLYNSSYGYSDLQPETTKSIDFTLGYKSLTLTYFQNKISNMIDFNTSTWKYYNIDGNVKMKGIEVSYKKDISQDLLMSLNYTYTSAKDANDKDLQRRAEQSFKFGFDYYGISKFHFNLNGEYVGNIIQYSYGTYNISANTGNYTLFNSVVNYELNKDTKLYVKLDNITNKYYQTVDGYATAPRSAYIGVNYQF